MSVGSTLTVIVPYLNAPDALQKCLAALALQQEDGAPFDVIVVDNGSDQIPTDICARHSFVTLIEEVTPGPGPARSRGAKLAESELLAFIDCDCIAQPGWIRTIRDYFAAHPETGVIGGRVRIQRADPSAATAVEAYESVFGYRMHLYVARDHYTATCNMAVRRDVFRLVGDFGGIDIAEDVDWGQRAHRLGIRIDYVPQMQIMTPARADFRELTRKWDRHIGHDLSHITDGRGRRRWIARALALAASPLAEIVHIVRTDRVQGFRERWLAFLCMTRIRWYRSWNMLSLLIKNRTHTASTAWRREQ